MTSDEFSAQFVHIAQKLRRELMAATRAPPLLSRAVTLSSGYNRCREEERLGEGGDTEGLFQPEFGNDILCRQAGNNDFGFFIIADSVIAVPGSISAVEFHRNGHCIASQAFHFWILKCDLCNPI